MYRKYECISGFYIPVGLFLLFQLWSSRFRGRVVHKNSFNINVRYILVDYCRPFEIVTKEPFPFFTPSLIYAFKFREARFYWLVNNGYYARRRIPAFKDSIGRYLELKENGARRDGTTKYRDDDAELNASERVRKVVSLPHFCHHSRILREFYANTLLSVISSRVVSLFLPAMCFRPSQCEQMC